MSALHSRKRPRPSKPEDVDSHAFAAYLTAGSAGIAFFGQIDPNRPGSA